MREISLCGVWRLRGRNASAGAEIDVNGTVPGCVHTDLIRNGIVTDLYRRDNADSFRWIEMSDWVYSRGVCVRRRGARRKLVFEGLDVYCDIYLNGTWIGHAENMFLEHVFAVDGILVSGSNTLEVYFYSPVLAVRGRKARPAAFTAERLYTRRMQCTYGWDWVDRFCNLRNLSGRSLCGLGKEPPKRTIFIFIRCRRTQNGRKLPPKCGSTEAAPHARSFLIRREDLFIKRIFTARRSSERSGFPLKIHSSGIRMVPAAAALFVSG